MNQPKSSKTLARLHKPDSDITKYDNENYRNDPLLVFRICEVRERRHYTFLKRKAAEEKIKLCRRRHSDGDDDDDTDHYEEILPNRESYHISRLRKNAKKIPVPKMLSKIKDKILSYLPNNLKEKNPELVNDYLNEIMTEYDKTMKIFSLNRILVHPESDDEDENDYKLPKLDFHFKYLGRTENYQKFLLNRQRIKKNLLITQPFIRNILASAIRDFPDVLTDFRKYNLENKNQPITLTKFIKKTRDDLNSSAVYFRWDWYPKIVNNIRKYYKKRSLEPITLWPKALNCATKLINRELNNLKIRTIKHLINVLLNKREIPKFELEIICYEIDESGKLEINLEPTYEVIVSKYVDLIRGISVIGSQIQPLETLIDSQKLKVNNSEFQRIFLNELCVQEFIDSMKCALKTTYKPILEYLENFKKKYLELHSKETNDDLIEFLRESKNFNEYFEKIKSYDFYIDELRNEMGKEYFEMADVNKTQAISALRKFADGLVKKVTQEIVIQHMKEETKICEIFESISRQALEIPRTTEQLLTGAEWMINVRTKQIIELNQRINDALKIGSELVSLTELSREHIHLQIKMINWLTEIEGVFDQNASMHESYKFQFEEHLQDVTKKLNDDITEMIPKLTIIDEMSDTEKFNDYNILLKNFIDQIQIFDDYVKWINKEEKLYKLPKSQYPILDAIKDFVIPFAELMRLCTRWRRHYYVWMDGPFEYLEPKFVEETTDEYYKEFLKSQKYYRNRIKQDMVGNPICKFRGQTEDPDVEKHPVPLRLCSKMIQWIKDFRIGVFIVNIMCNPALRKRHWNEMSEVANFDITPDAGTSLRKIINYKLGSKLNLFEIISVSANKELQLQQNLAAMIKEWDTIEFPTGPYKDTKITIFSNLDDLQALLDDHILKTLAMRGSAFMKPCEKEVLDWYEKLVRVNKTFEQWGKVQANYLYLLPIFSSKDIVAQMPEEGRLFNLVEQTYTRNMSMVLRNPLVMETAPAPGLLESLEKAVEWLEDITNGVNAYLEKKRLFFPRFFFLSNDEMLEILSETKDPLRVQPHLNKCFEGINRLEFDEHKDVLSMYSGDKENVKFVNKVSTSAAGGSVEKWLVGVETEMVIAVRNEIANSYTDYLEKKRSIWVLNWPQMVVLCVSQVFWALDVHGCLLTRNQSLIMHLFDDLTVNLNDIVGLIRSRDISNLNRITIKSLIVIDVHAKDVVEELIKNKVHSESDFQWLSQLRYYWENGETLVRIINATVKYANEYLGNSDRLVITPLTDRCYRTLIGAYQLHLNGAPEGPAGTGKTETTKDLAKAIAVQCKVFNCSDGLDYKAMGKFFKGLASCGAWACFDEFNRIELEVLSVVAQQILSIIQAVRAKLTTFVFEGTEIKLNPACYVCITMNPGYAGRSELPDNLKVLFRSVAMMVPDYAMIGEISLYSYGFVSARTLAVKIVTTYRLCSEQLSSQNHYDYGMRAVKAVLSACGNLKKNFPTENEDILLLRSLLDVNLPKFLSFDIPLFQGIISDLFPGVSLPPPDYVLMEKAFKETCTEMNLQPTETFLTKVIQTYEMMIVRHGFMLVGEPMAGKTSTLKVLANVLSKLKSVKDNPYYQNVQVGIVNPKSITMGQLYGAFDPISYEWNDGVVASVFRKFATDTTPDRKWVIFDGPVDAVWIENMNTVLDDNKKLCLNSGEIIAMTNEMSMIFEVMDLTQASPATVSRCGMIYMEPSSLGWKTFVMSWLNRCDPIWMKEWKNVILDLFEWIILPSQEFIRKNCKQLLNPGEFSVLRTTFDIFEMCIMDAIQENPEDYTRYLNVWFQAALLYAVNWGIGGILDAKSREKFDEWQRKIWNGENENHPVPKSVGKIDISIPLEGLLIDYIYLFKQKGAFKYWPDLLKKAESEETSLGVQVPTIDTGRYLHLLELHIKYKKKLLFVGPTGTGKSFYIQNYLMNKLPQENYVAAFMTLTVMITANQTQDLIISKLIKRSRGKYGPPKDKTCIIFVDDMNMPAKEIYGAQPPLELLRQYFDYSHWYDLKDTSKIFLNDLLIISACGLPGGSRQDVYSRFLCHFNIFSINNFSEETLNRIFVSVLMNGFKKTGHATDVIVSVNQIVNATLQIYKSACENLLPTPAKSHYVFNLRDISRICTGCALLRKESVENKKIFARLWYHEAMRVFFDRLVDEKDQLWLFQKLNDAVKDHFKERVETLLENYADPNGQVTLAGVQKLIFGTYLDEDAEYGEKKYEEVPSFETFQKVVSSALEEYNSARRSKLDIVLFEYALEHLNKLCRIMSIPGGSALLVGIGGSGRQSLTKLAAAICGETLIQPEITKTYSANDWHDDIKSVLKEAGGYGKDTVFLMTENQIKMELFLQDIDCLLNQGEVPNIYAIDEKQEILELVRLAAQGGNRNIDISPLQVFTFFVNRCKQKLHIILCFSPIGSSLRTRIRLYPSLVNCCTIDWYQVWPEEALQMVAVKYMDNVNVSKEVKDASIIACQHFHVTANATKDEFSDDTGRIIYITSASFLELIRSFQNLVNKKQKEIMAAKMRYVGGLETLQKASEAVATMQKELNELQPKLIEMAENSKKMMIEINTETVAVSAAAEQVKEDEIIANEQASAAQVLKDECEKDLAQAIPVLEDAIQALNTLKPTDITLVKTMKNPPAVIKLVMAAVCVIKSIPPDRVNDPTTGKKINDYWGPSKRILGDMGFLQSLKDFDKDNINPEVMKKIRRDFIPHKDFQPKIVAKASSAAEGLCKWIIAMDLYDNVAKIVAPKKARLQAAEKEYADTMKNLNEKRELLESLERKVALLNEELAKANALMQKTSDEVDFCKAKLQRAETLIGSLGGEKSRWTAAANNLQILFEHLPGDILISCGIIAYLAPMTSSYRNKCIYDWFEKCKSLKIPCSDVYSLIDVLGSDIKIQTWNIDGLPRDAFSTENSIIMDSSSRYSLFIDPQGQANKWIKNMEKSNRLQVIKFTQADYMKIIEEAIENGTPVLIENVLEELEVPLDPILTRNTFIQGGQEFISLGDNIVPMSPKFRLYLTSNLRNPHFLPEIFNKVTVINFALTQKGLEDQLLGIVVAKERPDLQELRQQLISEAAKNKALLKEAEDKILETLSTCEGDILENETAIQILDDSKNLAVDISSKQTISKETEVKIESFREKYQPVAIHSSVLYYSITDLPNIDLMYQFSLNWYINLYIFSIENANKSKDLMRRLKFLTDTITLNLYNNVCRSLFEKDKLLFSFILTTKIMIATDQINVQQLMFLLTGGDTPSTIAAKKPENSWITETLWNSIVRLEQLPDFKGFISSFTKNVDKWQEYYDSANPHLETLPYPWEEKTSHFEKIIILRAFRPDKVFMAISNFIETEMGSQYILPPPFDIAKSYEESNCFTPLIFILSPGADPMGSLFGFAEKMGLDESFQSISLGQGQGPIAQKMIEEAQQNGSWVCLQNCHLAASWMPKLEYIWTKMDIFNTTQTFRLWLTSYPSDKFPVSLLQNGVKMTNEPPTGLQQNLLRSYNSEPVNESKFYKGCLQQDRAFTRLLYGICFFHAVVQERRKFGPLGWNIAYGFNESDFQISVQQLQILLNQYDHVPYKAISYLTAECNYGGRVTDMWDRRAIVTILADYVNEGVVNDMHYKFGDDGTYAVPRKTEYKEVIRYIEENIPSMPSTEVYGLHSNAGINRDLQTSNLLTDSMILVMGRVSTKLGTDSEKSLLQTIDIIHNSLPNDFDIEDAKKKYPVDYNESMNTVLVQEMERFQKLLQEIRNTCFELKNAIKGIIVMTPELESVVTAINFKKVPSRWMSKSYPSLKPLGSYMADFLERLKWLQNWYEFGSPATFWISGFYFTQAFLTGAMQNYARKYHIPIDTLTFDFKVLDKDTMEIAPEDGVYINGLFIEGARWSIENNCLEEQYPKILIDTMPAIHLTPILIKELIENERYKCPLYKTAERKGTLSTTGHSTNYVLPILLETKKPQSHWVKRSTALICQTSD